MKISLKTSHFWCFQFFATTLILTSNTKMVCAQTFETLNPTPKNQIINPSSKAKKKLKNTKNPTQGLTNAEINKREAYEQQMSLNDKKNKEQGNSLTKFEVQRRKNYTKNSKTKVKQYNQHYKKYPFENKQQSR